MGEAKDREAIDECLGEELFAIAKGLEGDGRTAGTSTECISGEFGGRIRAESSFLLVFLELRRKLGTGKEKFRLSIVCNCQPVN